MIGDTPLLLRFSEADDGAITATLVELGDYTLGVTTLVATARYGTPGGEAFANALGKGGDVLRLNRRQHAAALAIDAAFRDAQWDRCREGE